MKALFKHGVRFLMGFFIPTKPCITSLLRDTYDVCLDLCGFEILHYADRDASCVELKSLSWINEAFHTRHMNFRAIISSTIHCKRK